MSQSDLSFIENNAGKVVLTWLSEFKFFNLSRVEIVENNQDLLRFNVYSFDQCYKFRVHDSYVGCAATNRRSRPAETWRRGSDLPDGKMERETLTQILGAILFYEAEEIAEITETAVTPPTGEAGGPQ
jgi:hypothetical protein